MYLDLRMWIHKVSIAHQSRTLVFSLTAYAVRRHLFLIPMIPFDLFTFVGGYESYRMHCYGLVDPQTTISFLGALPLARRPPTWPIGHSHPLACILEYEIMYGSPHVSVPFPICSPAHLHPCHPDTVRRYPILLLLNTVYVLYSCRL
jgi:hypothetical protein